MPLVNKSKDGSNCAKLSPLADSIVKDAKAKFGASGVLTDGFLLRDGLVINLPNTNHNRVRTYALQ